MKLDLIFIAEKLPNNFMPSLINRLSPKTYVNLRRTCTYMNNTSENAVDRNKLRVPLKNRSLYLELSRLDDDIQFEAWYYTGNMYFWDAIILPEDSYMFGFSYKTIRIEYVGDITEMSEEEIWNLDDRMSGFLIHLGCDELHVHNYYNTPNFFPFLYYIDSLKNRSLVTGEKYGLTVPMRLEDLTHPLFAKFACLSVNRCAFVSNFNLLDLCRDRQYLKLIFSDEWNVVKPMYTQFIEDIHNDVDIGPLRRFSFGSTEYPIWNHTPNTLQLGAISFSLLCGQHLTWIWTCGPSTKRIDASVYYAETKSRRLLLNAQPGLETSVFDLYIVPINNQSLFVQTLVSVLYETDYTFWHQPFPVDNSHLYSLLEEVTITQYPDIVNNYVKQLLNHVNRKKYMMELVHYMNMKMK